MKINENIAKQEKIHKKNCQPPMVKFVWNKVEECKDHSLAWGSLFFGWKLKIGHDQLFQPLLWHKNSQSIVDNILDREFKYFQPRI